MRPPWSVVHIAVLLVLTGGACEDGPENPPPGTPSVTAPGTGGSPGASEADPQLEVPAMAAKLTNSRTAWSAMKAKQGASYDYLSSWRIYPSGVQFQTRVEVRDDKVVRRSFGTAGQTPEWVETGSSVGSHPQSESPFNVLAPAVTIDRLYDECATSVLPLHSRTLAVTLRFHPSGVVEECTYRRRNCADTCDAGYRLSELFLPPPP